MSLPNYVYAGAAQPEALQIAVSPSESFPSLASVTAATITASAGSRSATWAATLSNQSATTLTLTHVFAADGSDVPRAGSYSLLVSLTDPGGTRRCEPIALQVRKYP